MVLVSDVDEVPRREVVRRLKECGEAMAGGAVDLRMDWCAATTALQLGRTRGGGVEGVQA